MGKDSDDQAIYLTLLGDCALTVGDITIRDFVADKERALLAYLALEAARMPKAKADRRQPQPHRREYLATLFWPESPPTLALKSLRQSLYRLKQVLDQAQPGLAARFL